MEEKKYFYATQCDPEFFDASAYWNEDDIAEDDIWLGGNRDFNEYNCELLLEARRLLDDAAYDVETCWDDYDEEDGNEDEVYEDQLEVVRDYTKIEDREKLEKILEIIEDYRHSYVNSQDEYEEYIMPILELLKDKKFKFNVLRGCCQGDWIYCIHPEAVSQDYLDYLEAVYFGTGTEFAITTEAITEEQLEDEDYDVTYVYTYLWNDKDVKEYLADEVGCKFEDLKVRTIRHTHFTRSYDYEII